MGPRSSEHTTTEPSRRAPTSQIMYSNGLGTFFLCALAPSRGLSRVKVSSYQGVGGTGAVPFHGVGGTGAVPFHGVGGTGAVPLAIITELSPCLATTVLRPIAPAKTSIASSIAVEMRDIVPPWE
jgi:hypothetical protein